MKKQIIAVTVAIAMVTFSTSGLTQELIDQQKSTLLDDILPDNLLPDDLLPNDLVPDDLVPDDPSFLGEFDPLADNFDPSQFTSEHIVGFSEKDIGHLTPEQIHNFDPEAMSGFDASQLGSFDPEALGGFGAEHFQNLAPEAIRGFGAAHVANIDPIEFQQMPDRDIAEMLVNFNSIDILPEHVQNLLPEDWNMDASGYLTPPAGTHLAFPPIAQQALDQVQMPDIPNFGMGFGLGGQVGEGRDVLSGLNNTLNMIGVEDFDFQQDQEDGILHVMGSGDAEVVHLSFIPDNENITQALEGTAPGISKNEDGQYVLTTLDGMQIPFIPAPANPTEIVNIIPNANLELGDHGEVALDIPGQGHYMGIFQEGVMPDPENRLPGHYCEGEPGVDENCEIVYEDGTMQEMLPTIQDPEIFEEAALGFPGMDDVSFQMDGTIIVIISGVPVRLIPAMNVTPGESPLPEGPSLDVHGPNSIVFVNAEGDSQVFYYEVLNE